MKKEKTILAEHVFEVRHVASGTFLDVRGYVADYIKECGLFPHWNIDANIVNFRDQEKKAKTDAAFISYKSAGYIVFDAPTKNYFPDKSIKFWKILNENNHYKISELLRIGIRTKAFFPLDKSFEEIRDTIYAKFYTKESQALIGGSLDDIQLIIDYEEEEFKVFLRGGPLKKGEAAKYFNFESEEFKNTGLFLDLDFFKKEALNHKDIPQLLNTAVDISWKKLETIARGLDF
ncbi:MAG: hypothetical protein DRI74_06975 [Bacteroidetes bacterium]|nr:MAG: hypothetical protein DRI74_06975 [Bacteroidota bacterium]